MSEQRLVIGARGLTTLVDHARAAANTRVVTAVSEVL